MTEHLRIDIEYPNANWARAEVAKVLDAVDKLAEKTDDTFDVEYVHIQPDTPTLENAEDAIFRVVDDVRALMESSTPIGYAKNLVDLQNSVANLATWHSGFDYETGLINGQDA